jgi:hypothetical protein
MRHRTNLIAVFIVAIVAVGVASAADQSKTFYGTPLGTAQYVNPASAKMLTDAPTSGISMPTNHFEMVLVVTIDDASVRYFFGSTNPTGSFGSKLEPGTYIFEIQQDAAARWKFTNDSSGVATVNVEYFGR